MRTSTDGILDILAHEAIVTRRYKDSAGVWTFGVGHTAGAGAPDPSKITTDRPIPEIIELFRRDLRKYEKRVEQAVKVLLEQHEFDALVSFDFNTGGIHKAKITQYLNAGDKAAAARAFMGWVRPPEIRDRRVKEMKLFRDGTYSNRKGLVTVYSASSAGRVLWSRGRQVNALRLLSGGTVDSSNRAARKVSNLRRSNLRIDDSWLTEGNVRALQTLLYSKGYGSVSGVPDGVFGNMTLTACEMFAREHNLPPNTVINAAFTDRVRKSGPREVPETRRNVTIPELANRGSQTIKSGMKAAGAVAVGGASVAPTVIDQVTETVDKVATPIGQHQNTLEWMWSWLAPMLWVLLPLVALAFAGWWIWRMMERRRDDERTGRIITADIPVQGEDTPKPVEAPYDPSAPAPIGGAVEIVDDDSDDDGIPDAEDDTPYGDDDDEVEEDPAANEVERV